MGELLRFKDSRLANFFPLIFDSIPRSMFFDEDGDLAHEFYGENDKGKMCRILENLRPQVPLIMRVSMFTNCVRERFVWNHQVSMVTAECGSALMRNSDRFIRINVFNL
jgi:hypothetical protein